MSPFEIFATLLSLVYIVLAVRNTPLCFVFGFIASALWAYESYFNLNLKFDALLNIYYVVMSIIGLYQWKYGGKERSELVIRTLGLKKNVMYIIGGVLLSLLLGYIGERYLGAQFGVLDALTTAFSILATYLLAVRVLDNWIYFIFADVLYVYIYYQTGAKLFMAMMILYTIMAVFGFYNWRKEMHRKTSYLDKI